MTDPSDGYPASPRDAADRRGPLAWFAQNSVAANMVMLVLMVGGLLMVLGGGITQEVFPEVDLDTVIVEVPYPGASPEEVEQGVILAIEEAVRGLDGVKEVTSIAAEGQGRVMVELLIGTDPDRALSDVKSSVDRITSFPEDAERPVISLATNRRKVVSMVLYGEAGEETVRAFAEQARTQLLQDNRITQVELSGVRPLEISVEVPQRELREHDLTLGSVAGRIRQASVDLPGGDVETEGGEILLRTKERRETGQGFANIVLKSQPDGTKLRVRDIATIEDGFREVDRRAYFNGEHAIMIDAFRVGDETPQQVSNAVHEYIEEQRSRLPPGLGLSVWADRSEIYKDRIDLLLRNAYLGLVLVLLTLGLFLEIRLAFWVTLGIPISFLGGLLFMPSADVTLNMISLFAFIVSLGMVVDDAIVAGEAIYRFRQEGRSRIEASILGAREVAVPVTFSVLTTCIAFAPLLFVPGLMGKFFRVIPTVVILVLLISLVEALVILPAHLSESGKSGRRGAVGAWIHRQQQRFSRALERFIEGGYGPFMRGALRWRYLTFATCVAVLVATLGLVAGGRLKSTFMPDVEGDVVTANLELPVGTPIQRTRAMQRRLEESARETLKHFGQQPDDARGLFADLGVSRKLRGAPMGGGPPTGSHLATVMIYLSHPDTRAFGAGEFARQWRREVDSLPGAETLTFDYSLGTSGGAPVALQLSHGQQPKLEKAATRLAEALHQYEGVKEIDDGVRRGKQQLDLTLKPAGRALGLTESDLARQVRNRFFGAEAVRQQRGRNELRVYVRLPDRDRRSLHTVEQMVLQTPAGGEIPLAQAAEIHRGRAYTEITRTNGRRTIDVTADVVPGVANGSEVVQSLERDVLPDLMQTFPGLSYSLSGQQQERADAMSWLAVGFLFALVAMFGMLAVVFRSYIQPVIVMIAIPFGMVGALWGHVAMGYSLSIMSMMGVVALSGVVVNASLILIVAINEFRRRDYGVLESVVTGGKRRFRPILLTSLTTFLGLSPMITETSTQARFLIPMAISLGFGVLFAALITLIVVPAAYLIVEDVRTAGQRIKRATVGGEDVRLEPEAGE